LQKNSQERGEGRFIPMGFSSSPSVREGGGNYHRSSFRREKEFCRGEKGKRFSMGRRSYRSSVGEGKKVLEKSGGNGPPKRTPQREEEYTQGNADLTKTGSVGGGGGKGNSSQQFSTVFTFGEINEGGGGGHGSEDSKKKMKGSDGRRFIHKRLG